MADTEGRESLRILAGRPDDAAALHRLGLAAYAAGRTERAGRLIRRALACRADMAGAHANLAVTLAAQGRYGEAALAARGAIVLDPGAPAAHNTHGHALSATGRNGVYSFRRALAAKPDYVDALNNLGLAAALPSAFRAAVALSPGFAPAYDSLADLPAARRSVLLQPGSGQALANLAAHLQASGRRDEAMRAARAALVADPALGEAFNNLAGLLRHRDGGEALRLYRRALLAKPGHVNALANLGDMLVMGGRGGEADALSRRGLVQVPSMGAVLNSLANARGGQGRTEDAVTLYRRALACEPANAAFHSNLLLVLNNESSLSPGGLMEEHRRFQARMPAPPPRRPVSAARPLRVGFVSPDFRHHSVSFFFEPLLRHRDRSRIEAVCYSDVLRPDAVTDRLRHLADGWVEATGLSDTALAERIAADGIEVLVDLAGHTAGNRLPVFARRPAPVQITWLGYPHSTGLEAMDYRLVDDITDPAPAADRLASEKLIRIDNGFLCYQPPASPEARRLSAALTFGSFNNPAKLSAATIACWADLLRAVPQARLLLKGQAFADPATILHVAGRFAALGIDRGRLDLRGQTGDMESHLGLYGMVDIALDPFPYNGTTTTCEALWMGVPVVALLGDRHAGRVGASLLHRVGLDDCVAATTGDYVAIAARLASDPARLDDLRRTLRDRMAASALCDAPGFARRWEAALSAAIAAEER